jgi:folate-binding protein YgfZ
MNNWKQFLLSQGARLTQGDDGWAQDFGIPLNPGQLTEGFVSAIGSQGLIAASGEDAASFLHKQLSNDIEHLEKGQLRLAGYCSPKGRLLASFLVWRSGESILLQLPSAMLPAIQKRLQMFVLRDKAKLADASNEPAHAVMMGIGGTKAQSAMAALFPALPLEVNSVVEGAAGMLMRLPDAFGAPRYQWLTAVETAVRAWNGVLASLHKGGEQAWQLACIHAGVAQITNATQDQFVPQMINFELLGGVNFKKGCYPGQEIVARSQYLGKLKRRAALARVDQLDVAAGMEVVSADDPGQPCGMVVNAADNGLGGTDALVEMKLAALEAGKVHLGSATGPMLLMLPMPYPLDALDL